MSIYSDTTNSIQTLMERYQSLSDGVTQGNRASLDQCIILSMVKEALVKEHGGTNTPSYKREVRTLTSLYGLTKQTLNRDARIGEYIKMQNDPDMMKLSKRAIEQKMKQREQKEEKKQREKKPDPEIAKLDKRVSALEKVNDDYREIIGHFQKKMEEAGVEWLEYLEARHLPTYSIH